MRFNKYLALAFAVLMLVFIGYAAWHTIQRSTLEAELADRQKTLDTNLGRVNKQKTERAREALRIPGALIVQDCLTPLVESAGDDVALWKQRRDQVKGSASTIRAAAQDALDRAKAAEAALAEARARIEAALAKAGQEP